MARTTVQVTESSIGDRDTKQYRATIPKSLAEALNLEQGDELEWSIGRASNKMEVEIIQNNE